jgi:hypothetical protein
LGVALWSSFLERVDCERPILQEEDLVSVVLAVGVEAGLCGDATHSEDMIAG